MPELSLLSVLGGPEFWIARPGAGLRSGRTRAPKSKMGHQIIL